MENPLIRWLQDWFTSWCDGDWEHTYGVEVETLDNPGWRVTIDLIGTDLENRYFPVVEQEISEDNWFYCRVRDNAFEGAGGPINLEQILQTFRAWAESNRRTIKNTG